MQRSGDAAGCDHSHPSLARKRQPREEEDEEEEGRKRERRRRERERHRKRRSSQPAMGEPWRASGAGKAADVQNSGSLIAQKPSDMLSYVPRAANTYPRRRCHHGGVRTTAMQVVSTAHANDADADCQLRPTARGALRSAVRMHAT
ncbi:unnamed protein product [Prorocentrum cordatum]|uniref:Uncharacterized protein n=1 Tax=Prorocentrum cordatum TaxID=2364126 RepID=A0ABN9SRM7_9DINO|nr:unnamed protein product [Polarella glacialis]